MKKKSVAGEESRGLVKGRLLERIVKIAKKKKCGGGVESNEGEERR